MEKAIAGLSLLSAKYQAAARSWKQRKAAVDEALSQCAQDTFPTARFRATERYLALAELHDTAARMESKYGALVLGISERVSVLEGRLDAIRRSTQGLEDSRARLNASRSLALDRQNLSRISYELAASGGVPPRVRDMGLGHDLREAQAAVLAAEALMELKGDQP
ncbi:MAG TPA: hypothetical protein VJP90_07280 [Paenarthrobacter sp.]|nr:hypothetical protein [Paenarthrobacter sp.]